MTEIEPCEQCGEPHVTRFGAQACAGHGTGIAHPERGGLPCRQRPINGLTVCRAHGGGSAKAKAAGAARLEQQEIEELAERWGAPIETTPTEAILKQINVWAGLADFYGGLLETLPIEDRMWGVTKKKVGGDDAGTTSEARPHVLIGLHESASRNLVKFASEALHAGVEERRVRLAEQQGHLVADVIRGTAEAILKALLAAGMPGDLESVFKAALSEAAPRQLRLLNGGAA